MRIRMAVSVLVMVAMFVTVRQLTSEPAVPALSVAEVQQRHAAGGEFLIIDVREPEEFAAGHIPGAKLIPLAELQVRMSELDRGVEIIVVCLTDNRSARATRILVQAGFDAKHMRGGMLQWRGPVVKTK
ncbi:MAG: rhodanese-like domain-containing protein [Bacillota bacterium]